jgi:ATP-dependent DNA helicase PIF1
MSKRAKPTETETTLDDDQLVVVDAALEGRNVYFTGPAGTGKSHVLKHIIGKLSKLKRTFVTSSTGVSALNIGGTTLHSFAGLGLGKDPVDTILANMQHKGRQAKDRIQKAEALIIDEISMINAELFDKADELCRRVRKTPDKPFGGIQIIACGDFFQLSPVEGAFAFESASWSKTFDRIIQLKRIHRQQDGSDFVKALNAMRIGVLTDGFAEQLEKDKDEFYKQGNGVLPTRLLCRNREVDEVNQFELNELKTPKVTFKSKDTMKQSDLAMNDLFPIPESLTLAVGAQVMMVKNTVDYANGTRGVITEINQEDDEIHVRGLNGALYIVRPERYQAMIHGVEVATRTNYPLKLAWAISIHKSQGLSINYMDVDLSGVFSAAQAYVAVSRATEIEGVRVTGLTDDLVYCHPKVLKFHGM